MPRAVNHKSVVCVTVAGDRGAGKSFIAVNLASAMALQGKRVLLLDMNPFPNNSGLFLGINAAPPFQFLPEQIVRNRFGIDVIFCGKSSEDTVPAPEIDEKAVRRMLRFLTHYEVIIFDGQNDMPLLHNSLLCLAPKTIMVFTPSPESITPVYAQAKGMVMEHLPHSFCLLVNRTKDEKQTIAAIAKLTEITNKFLGRQYELLETIPETVFSHNPIFGVKPLMVSDINNPGAKKILAAAKKLLQLRDISLRLTDANVTRLLAAMLS